MMSALLRVLAGVLRRQPASAEEWMVLSQSDRMTPRQQRALTAWLNAAPEHAREYSRCLQLARLSSQLRAQRMRHAPTASEAACGGICAGAGSACSFAGRLCLAASSWTSWLRRRA